MDSPQSLQSVAEISIAFAGFSGLVVALRKDPGPLTEVQKYRLRVLLALSFGALFLSLLPELLSYLGVTEAMLWARASIAAALFSLVFLAWWVVRSRHMMQLVPEIFDWFAVARMLTGHIIVVVPLLLVATAVIVDAGAGVYLAALIWYLMHAAQQFSRMLFIQPSNDDTGHD